MDITHISTSLAPAIMLFLIAIIVKFFPPTRHNNALVVKAPEWWARDQKTWDLAHSMLAKRYVVFSLVLAVLCAALLFFKISYGATLGYVLLAVLFVLANVQIRKYMNSNIK